MQVDDEQEELEKMDLSQGEEEGQQQQHTGSGDGNVHSWGQMPFPGKYSQHPAVAEQQQQQRGRQQGEIVELDQGEQGSLEGHGGDSDEISDSDTDEVMDEVSFGGY
jgi:hypothetical protein